MDRILSTNDDLFQASTYYTTGRSSPMNQSSFINSKSEYSSNHRPITPFRDEASSPFSVERLATFVANSSDDDTSSYNQSQTLPEELSDKRIAEWQKIKGHDARELGAVLGTRIPNGGWSSASGTIPSFKDFYAHLPHTSYEHPVPPTFQCEVCSRQFNRFEHLTRHVRSHTKEKPFSCPVCNRAFARNDMLLRHCQNLHSNVQGIEHVGRGRIRKRLQMSANGDDKK